MDWSFVSLFLLIPLNAGIGWLASSLQSRSLHRRTYSLECGLADVESKLLIEIKRRAGHERQKDTKIDAEILEAAKNKEVQPELPWWAKIKQA